MRLRHFLGCLLLFLPVSSPAQTSSTAEPGGIWLGRLDTGSSVRLQLHLEHRGDGWQCTYDEIERGRAGQPCTITVQSDMVAIRFGKGETSFQGKLTADTLQGTFHGSVDVPLLFERKAAAMAVTTPQSSSKEAQAPTREDLLLGGYGPYRVNNDLLSYKLQLRVDPETKSIRGSNAVRFRMLQDGQRLQLELAPSLTIDGVTMGKEALHYERPDAQGRTFYIDAKETLHQGQTYEVTVAYHGTPVTQGRFGCFSFNKDQTGKPWITTACEGEGPSIWWPNKDQWRDEPQEGMEIDIAVPNGLMDVSNGRFGGSTDLHDGYTEWRWHVHYPINNYDVALNIANYEHFSLPQHGATTLDFYVLPADLEKAKQQFQQVPGMLDAYEHYFGEYPFVKDGYKLVQVPYAGMEHQSAVAYGNHFENGYYGRDWTGVGISPKFDFIIIHESGHEWFGNAVTAADRSDMWIHEGWTTYLECLYVEYRFGKAEALRYTNGLKWHADNEQPIIPTRGTDTEPPEDQYFKGALMLNTLRTLIGDDTKWFADIHDFYQHFKYQTTMTEDVVAWWNERTGMNLTPFFNEYLRDPDVPSLELKYLPTAKVMLYRWHAQQPDFAMPIEAGDPQHWTRLQPTAEWQKMPWPGTPESFHVDIDHYYVNVAQSQWQ